MTSCETETIEYDVMTSIKNIGQYIFLLLYIYIYKADMKCIILMMLAMQPMQWDHNYLGLCGLYLAIF